MSAIEIFIAITMLLTALMFAMVLVVVETHRDKKRFAPTIFPVVGACCLCGIALVMLAMVVFLFSQGFGQYLFV